MLSPAGSAPLENPLERDGAAKGRAGALRLCSGGATPVAGRFAPGGEKLVSMNWKIKAFIQKVVALLPARLGEPIYYLLQRKLGNLRRVDPFSRFEAGVKMAKLVQKHGGEISDRQVLEIGTGWRVNTALALWLLGTDVVTVDLNRFLKPELVSEDIRQLVAARGRVEALVAPLELRPDRWEALVCVARTGLRTIEDVWAALPGITYLAPRDASRLKEYGEGYFYGSFTYATLEHIAPQTLQAIFLEVARLSDPQGLGVHMVDHSDHFAHADSAISSVHFLRYTPEQWARIGGNRFAYCNRLRSSEVAAIFKDSGFCLLEVQPRLDVQAAERIEAGLDPLWSGFAALPAHEVAVLDTWYVMRPPAHGVSQVPAAAEC